MSYAGSDALQAAIYTALSNDAAVTALVGSDIFDAVPSGALPSLYLAIGEERVLNRSSITQAGAVHDFVVKVHGDVSGFQAVKQTAGAVCDALIDADLVLTQGSLTSLEFRLARATKGVSPDQRVISLTFRARVSDL